MRCFNLGGTDWLGRPLRKVVSVPQGKVQALWFGVAVPRDAAPGTYRGTVTLRAKNAPATPVTLTLNVSDKVLEDAGDGELWRHARLRWLDSTIGLDDEVFPPYTPVGVAGQDLAVLGRAVRLADTGLFSSITSSFTRNVDGIDAAPQELLAEPMRLVVQPEGGPPVIWQGGGPKIAGPGPGRGVVGGDQHGGRAGTACAAPSWNAMATSTSGSRSSPARPRGSAMSGWRFPCGARSPPT